MNRKKLIPSLALLVLATSCSQRSNVVCESYVHRYGVPLSGQEWATRGRDGTVISTRDDGVVVSCNYERGVMHGETTYTYPHRDTIQKRENYHQGSLTQETWSYSNGFPSKQVNYTSPSNQTTVVWFDNGAPQSKEEHENGLLIHGQYYTTNQQQEATVENKNGTRIVRDNFGNIQAVDQIQEGQIASRTTYHPNGAPQSVTPHVNNLPEGKKLTYQPGGEPNTVETWVAGKQQGITIEYENGEPVSEVPYVNGKKNGTEHRYRDGEHLVQEVSWVNGRKHGPTNTYVGNSKKTEWYFQDRPVNKQTFDALSNQ